MIDLRDDVYYNKLFAKLYADIDVNDELITFSYKKGEYYFINYGIKRPILSIGNIPLKGKVYFDMETPYGYGGFYTNTNNKEFLNNAFEQYKKYCFDNNIIAEFIRFHPLNNNVINYSPFINFISKDRQVVVVDTNIDEDLRWNNYSSKTRNIIRKCIKNDLKFSESNNVDEFINMYNLTMKRNNADDFYYFNKDYFYKLYSRNDVKLFQVSFQNKIIAMSFMLLGKDIAHYHLSANTQESLKLNANYFILDKMFSHAKNKKKKLFLLGGGRTNSADDSLFKFKKKFSQNIYDFYIGGLIHNKEKYKQYIDIWENQNKELDFNYFLKYRL